jgi:hypothetical protein
VPETTRGELDARGKPKLRVTGKLGIGLAIVHEMFGRECSLEN